MTPYQVFVYRDLLRLTQTNEAFYTVDQVLDGVRYRIFNYRLASYTDFCNPSSTECRGIMFELDQNDDPIRLASMPMEKFFNLNEVSPDINTLAETLVKQGRLSQDVFDRAKNRNTK